MSIPKHLVIRYSDKFGATIDLHNQVARKNGYVWFGKMGTVLASRWIAVFQNQLKNGMETWLYVVKRENGKILMHKGLLLDIHRTGLPPADGCPDYYQQRKLIEQMSCFFKLEGLVACSNRELASLRLSSTGSPLSETLANSMAGLFIVSSLH